MPNQYYTFKDICRDGRRVEFTMHMIEALKFAVTTGKAYKGWRNSRSIASLVDLDYLEAVNSRAYAITAAGAEAWEKIERTQTAKAAK